MTQEQGLTDGTQGDKVLAGRVLVLAQLSVFIEQSAIPRITEASNHQIDNIHAAIQFKNIFYCFCTNLY